MSRSEPIELGLTIPLQRHLHIKALPYGQESDRRFCWDLHVITLRGRPSLLAVHCHSRYTFVLYDLIRLDWERLPEVFREGLAHSLSAAGFPAEAADLLCGSDQPLFTKTHGRREVAFLNRAWDDVMAAHELGLGSCWINRAKEEFDTPWGRDLLKSLDIEGEYEGIGHCALGYIDGDVPEAAPRKENRVFYIK